MIDDTKQRPPVPIEHDEESPPPYSDADWEEMSGYSRGPEPEECSAASRHEAPAPKQARTSRGLWVRHYVSESHDPRFTMLDDKLFRTWIDVLNTAGSVFPGDGIVSKAEFASVFRVKPYKAKASFEALEKAGLLVRLDDDRWRISDWSTRRNKGDLSTERTRKSKGIEG